MGRGINASATLYNYYRNPETRQEEWHPVYLEAIHWENGEGVNAERSGIRDADGLTALVWLDAKAEGRKYIPPKAYALLAPEDMGNYWTITKGKDRIVRGEIFGAAVTADITDIVNRYDDCYTIMHADMINYGPQSQHHLELSGK